MRIASFITFTQNSTGCPSYIKCQEIEIKNIQIEKRRHEIVTIWRYCDTIYTNP